MSNEEKRLLAVSNGDPTLIMPGNVPPTPSALAADRVTVVEMACFHSIETGQDLAVNSRYSRVLKSRDEQPFYRRCRVGEQWAPIERGHLARCSYMHVRNCEGQNPRVIPTPAEREAVAERVVELRFEPPVNNSSVPHVLVRPATWQPNVVLCGEACRVEPCRLDLMWIRCRKGTATVELNIFPE